MPISPDPVRLLRIVDDLATQGWSQQTFFLPEALTRDLAAECNKRFLAGELLPAGVGRAASKVHSESVRGDRIQWLEPDQAPACDAYLALMDSLRVALNRDLFLGLDDYESHFAFYPPGAFYRRHVDRFRDDDRRVVSAVLYLNEAWLPAQGGQLRLYLPDGVEHDVQPAGGSLVVFMSSEMPHEVLAANRERLSLTGWFRRSGSL